MGEIIEQAVYEVIVVRKEFEYAPVVNLPAWWTPGQRQTASRGDNITVGQADYDRGRRYGAFANVPPLPSREVTVLHGCFDYTPQPFPRWEPEHLRQVALRGQTIRVLEDEYERGKRAGAFDEWKPSSPYGVVGDPPLTGSVISLLNWVRAASPEVLELMITELEEKAGASAKAQQLARELRAVFARPTDTNGQHLAENINRAHELIGQLQAEVQQDELGALVNRLISNPEVLALVTRQQQRVTR